ncbi:unnamed protein product [Malus baccata var. baccata]
MEGDHHHSAVLLDQRHVQAGSGRAGDSGSTSRWNPTKEQIDMLENFYKQGVRTPSAEQIQQITSSLKAFGHIEGKNVFYWFQNHKARQRQKQKQESIAYNRLLHRRTTQPIFLPPYDLNLPCPNVMCSPYYVPVHSELGFYPQSPYPNKVPLPGVPSVVKRRPRAEKLEKRRTTCTTGGAGYEPMNPHNGYNTSGGNDMINDATSKLISKCDQQTLPLFPLQPTGILQQGREDQNYPSTVNDADCSSAALIGSSPEQIVGDRQPFYDFFSA